MEYFGIKEVKGKAVVNEVIVKKKQRRKNLLNLTGWTLGVLNAVAYALLAVRLFF